MFCIVVLKATHRAYENRTACGKIFFNGKDLICRNSNSKKTGQKRKKIKVSLFYQSKKENREIKILTISKT